MSLSVVPFTSDHLDAAAALLAARHARDRARQPALAARFTEPAAARTALDDVMAEAGSEGVAALCGTELVGYLIGATVFSEPRETFAGFMPPRATDVASAGHAVAVDRDALVYPPLYAALATRWLARGIAAHNLDVPATPEQTATWADLGFGRFIELGVRETAAPVDLPASHGNGVVVRRAESGDADAIHDLVTELWQSFADAPIFIPYLPETTATRRQFVTEYLADARCPIWLAWQGGRLVGMQLFVEPDSPHYHIGPLQAVERSVYLFLACTRAEARSQGIGAALFAHAMLWAGEAGYTHCLAHHLTASRAARFWRGLGFQPVSHWIRRFVDDRAIWAMPGSGNGC